MASWWTKFIFGSVIGKQIVLKSLAWQAEKASFSLWNFGYEAESSTKIIITFLSNQRALLIRFNTAHIYIYKATCGSARVKQFSHKC